MSARYYLRRLAGRALAALVGDEPADAPLSCLDVLSGLDRASGDES